MKTITVKGIGKASAQPDWIVLSLSLDTTHPDYGTAMHLASYKIDQLNAALEKIGFEAESVKTADFHVHTDYRNHRDAQGNYHQVFDGYRIIHRLKIAFDFDTQVLAKALGAVSACAAEPELSVRFTVKDTAAINQQLLQSAATNARAKAEILCTAAGASLGELVNIQYSWGELNVYSHTQYDLAEDCNCLVGGAAPKGIDIHPEDIDVSDTVTFVWQIA